MPPFSRVFCVAAIGFLWLGVTGCGGGVPSTGESLKGAGPDFAVKRKEYGAGIHGKDRATQRSN